MAQPPVEAAGAPPSPELEAARAALKGFLEGVPRSARLAAMHDSDADGVTTGVVWQRACERLGFESVTRLAPDRERNAWTPANRECIRAAQPQALFVMDLGSRHEPVIEGVPCCFIDHHRPEGAPPGDTLISGYNWEPIPNTSLLVFDAFAPLVNVFDLDWIAAVGTISDLGERAPFALLNAARRKYTAKHLKEATTLINAARRASALDPEIAARALLSHPDPRALVNSPSEDVQRLKAARQEVRAAMEEAKKAAPLFAGQVALIRASSPCQIHPLLAQIWRTRLPQYIVIAANEGYLPGRVNFSARAPKGTNVLSFLKGIELSPGEGTFGHGHDHASGGSLPLERWNELLQKLGFSASS